MLLTENKKAQAIFVYLMIAVVLLIATFQFIPTMQEFITDARGADGLNCTDPLISTGKKATCIIVDVTLPYYIGIAFAVALSIMMVKAYK